MEDGSGAQETVVRKATTMKKKAPCPAFPGKTGLRAPPRPCCSFGQPRGAAQQGGSGDQQGRQLSQPSPEGKGARQDPASPCLSAAASSTPGLEELLVPQDIHAKCQSTGRGKGPSWADGIHGCLGTASPPRKLQLGAHARTNASAGKRPSSSAASWGDEGSL